jgi:signal transduction histidine kinase
MSELKLAKPIVLYVDDDRHNLMLFEASFQMDFEVLLANSPDEAFELLKKHEPQVIISDYRMPFMTGLEMFEKIRLTYPAPFRVLLTAYGDVEVLTDAINKAQIFRYIKKPLIEDEIRNVVKDATEYYQTNWLLEEKNRELAEAYKELDRFVYSVSHDLRSPLMAILAIAGFLQKTQKMDEVHEFGDMITSNVSRLDEFISNLLEYYKVKRGELTISAVKFDKLLEDVKGIYAIELMEKKINCEIFVSQNEEFKSDKLVLLIVIQNLVSNSIKYQKLDNPDKQIFLSAIVNKGEVIITVKDNGIGIGKEFQPRVFEMFFRASSQAMGSGIGLYNANMALNKLGGEISIESENGQGTTVVLKISSK